MPQVKQDNLLKQCTSDTLIKTGNGSVHTVTFSCADAAPTAGTIAILDSITAGAGTTLFTWTCTTAVFTPVTITLNGKFGAGLYVDFTTTADVSVTVSYN